MSDLLVTTHTPTLDSGRALRTYGVARALAALAPLDLLYVRFGAAEPAREYLETDGLRLHAVAASRGPRRALAYALARLHGVPAGFARGASPELAAAAASLAGHPGRGRVVADGPVAAAALRSLARRRPVIYNSHNLESAFRHDVDAHRLGSRRGLAAFERGLFEGCAESWLPSRADMEGARALAPAAALRYVPNVIDVARIAPLPVRPAGSRALFLADFTYAPNRRGVQFLLEEVFPLVREELPDAELVLAGRGLEPSPAQPHVSYLGYVADVATAYARADCALVALREGGGSPLKFIEALAYGIPVVATPRAARGLDLRAGEHYLRGEGGAEFAAQVVRALSHGALDVAAHGRALVETEYSIEALTRILAR